MIALSEFSSLPNVIITINYRTQNTNIKYLGLLSSADIKTTSHMVDNYRQFIAKTLQTIAQHRNFTSFYERENPQFCQHMHTSHKTSKRKIVYTVCNYEVPCVVIVFIINIEFDI